MGHLLFSHLQPSLLSIKLWCSSSGWGKALLIRAPIKTGQKFFYFNKTSLGKLSLALTVT